MRPDILWLYCDELRADALGCYGSPLATPAMDALAESGLVFTSSWCNSPVCVPSRVALLTGRSPEQTGVFHNEAQSPGYPVPDDLVTFPEVLAEHGYRTASVGKEHIPPALRPWQVDDHTGSEQTWLRPVRERLVRPQRTGLGPNALTAHLDGDGAYPPTALTVAACAQLAELSSGDHPFLLRASYLQPHTPVVPPVAYDGSIDPFSAYAGGTDLSDFERAFAAAASAVLSPAELHTVRANYADLVQWVDGQLGIVVRAFLATRPQRPKVILLTSDHGANIGENGTWGKHTFAPQSHRVPLVLVAPGLEPGVRDDLVQSLDVARTLLALCGVPVPASFGGRDLLGSPPPEMVLASIGYGNTDSTAYPNRAVGTYDGHGWPRRTCVRTDRYRLDATTRIDGRPATVDELDVFLADRLDDPFEVHNRAEDPALADVRDRLLEAVLTQAATARELPDGFLTRLFEPPAFSRETRASKEPA